MPSTIFIAGHRGMVGSALVRLLASTGEDNLLLRTRADLDLLEPRAVEAFFNVKRPQRVYLAAARVGGIWANQTRPAEFIYENLMIEANVIRAAWRCEVERVLFLGSSCIYPRDAPQPITESALLGGPLESTNEPYAIAKIAGIKLCESFNRQYGTDFRSLMPTNLYGPGDRFDLEQGHVIPALMRRFHEAKIAGDPEVSVWGTGTPRREFLHVDDLAAACVQVMELDRETFWDGLPPMCSHLNVGTGTDLSIRALAEIIRKVVGYEGAVRFDSSKPDGTPSKRLDVTRLNQLGWSPRIELRKGLEQTYAWYLEKMD